MCTKKYTRTSIKVKIHALTRKRFFCSFLIEFFVRYLHTVQRYRYFPVPLAIFSDVFVFSNLSENCPLLSNFLFFVTKKIVGIRDLLLYAYAILQNRYTIENVNHFGFSNSEHFCWVYIFLHACTSLHRKRAETNCGVVSRRTVSSFSKKCDFLVTYLSESTC